MRQLVMFFASVCLAACGQGGCVIFTHPFAPDGGTCRFDPLRFEHYLTPGVEAEVEFGHNEQCASDIQEFIPVGITAVVKVMDPDGKAWEHKTGSAVRRQLGISHYEDAVKVTFTPDRPGRWRLIADFGLALPVATQDIQVIEWRGDAAARVIPWNVPTECVSFAITAKDTAICLQRHTSGDESIATSRGEVFPGGAFAFAGDGLWRLTATGVERLEDDGAAFVSTHRVSTPFTFAGSMNTDGHSAWLVASSTATKGPLALLHLTPQPDGGLAVDAFSAPGLTGHGVLGAPNAALVLTDGVDLAIIADGGVTALTEGGALWGRDRQALWILDSSDPFELPGQFHVAVDLRAAWIEGGSLRTATLEAPRESSFTQGVFGAPIVDGDRVPRLSDAGISIEAFDAGPDYAPVGSATTQHGFARALDGQSLLVLER